MMNRIARLTNEYILAEKISHPIPKMMQESKYRNAALAHGVKSIVNDMDARLIIVWTKFGGGALYLSQLDIPRSIIAFSDNRKTLNRLALLYGIQPEYMKQFTSLSDFIGQVNLMVIEKGWAKKGEPVVFVYGEPLQASGVTNSIYVHYLE
jgi:pyruvate kinase